MSAYGELLARVQDAILRADPVAAQADLAPHPRLDAAQRLAIYADGYRLRLTDAVRSDYPALAAHLGADAFDALARDYVEATPSQSWNLDRYPHGFNGFAAERLGGFAADLARLEGAIAQVFMLPGGDPLTVQQMAALDAAALATFVLRPRAASALLQLDYPADDWLRAQREGEMRDTPAAQEQCLFLVRHMNEVQRHNLPPAAFALLNDLLNGTPLGDAAEKAVSAEPTAPIQSWLGEWINAGFFRS